MARLASIAKAGYYPTPPRILMELLKTLAAPYGGRVLDPCAGTGLALIQIANTLRLEAYANELDTNRAAQAANLLNAYYASNPALPHRDKFASSHALTGAMENLAINGGTFNLLFLNPPYDNDDKDGRLERTFLTRGTHWLQAGGLLVFLIPQSALRLKAMNQYLASWYPDLTITRFPDPDYQIFKQHIITGVRSKRRLMPDEKLVDHLLDIGHDRTTAPTFDPEQAPRYTLPILQQQHGFKFQPTIISYDDVLAEIATHGAAQNPELAAHLAPQLAQRTAFSPLMPLKQGHMAGLIAAGYLNNQVLKDDEQRLLIRGRSYRVEQTRTEDTKNDDGTTSRKTIVTERPVTDLTVLDANGNLTTIEPQELPAFLNQWLPQLSQAIVEQYQPAYTFDPGIFAQRMGKYGSLLSTQLHVAAATALRLTHHDDAIIVGEMGTGKTRTAGAVIRAIQAKRTLVVCPPHLADKWCRELAIVNPTAHIQHLQTLSDFTAWMSNASDIKIGVIKFTTARAGSGWEPAYNYWQLFTPEEEQMLMKTYEAEANGVMPPTLPPNLQKKQRYFGAWRRLKQNRGVRCATTGRMLVDHNGNPITVETINTSRRQFNRTERGGATQAAITRATYNAQTTIGTAKTRTRYCAGYQQVRPGSDRSNFARHAAKERSFRQELKARGYGKASERHPRNPTTSHARFPLATFIGSQYAGHIDLLIADEVQQLKGQNTDQGFAFGRLSRACKKTLALTGTIYGGKASTLFPILYRMADEVRDHYTNKEETGTARMDVTRWIADHGMIETIETSHLDEHGKQTGNKRSKQITREASGSSPTMLPWLLSRTAFMSLADMGTDLPPYEEIPYPVQMDNLMQGRHSLITNELYSLVVDRLVKGDRSLLGAYLQTSLCWPDAPWRDEIVVDPKTKDDPTPQVVFKLPALPIEMTYPKEDTIIELAQQEIAEGRNVLLLCQQTRTRDITPRWMELLKAAGLRPAVLRADASRREAWIDNAHKQGINVIIAHPKAVETGLDILHYPTVIWMGTEYSVYTVMQASRRPYRIIQDKPVRVYFVYYEKTMQETALHIIATKAAAATRVNGDVIHQNSVADLAAGNVEDVLAQQLTNGKVDVPTTSLTEMFAQANRENGDPPNFIGNYKSTPVILEAEPVEQPVLAAPAPAPIPAPAAVPPLPTVQLPKGWTREDVEYLLKRIKDGHIVLVGDTNLGIPTIHDEANDKAEHLGFGCFKVYGKNSWTFDGGGAMSRTPNGKGYTIVQVISGTFPYDRNAIIHKLETYLVHEPISVQIQTETAPVPTSKPIQAPVQAEPTPAPSPTPSPAIQVVDFKYRAQGVITTHPAHGLVKVLYARIVRQVEAQYAATRFNGIVELENGKYWVYQPLTTPTAPHALPQPPTQPAPAPAPAAPRQRLVFGQAAPKAKRQRKPTSTPAQQTSLFDALFGSA